MADRSAPVRPPGTGASSPEREDLNFRFVSIAGDQGAAVVTPIGSSPPGPSSPPHQPAMEIDLCPLELISFGYSCGAAPKGCRRVVNCSHLAVASPASAASPGGSWTSTPQIDELCSFLLYELQALAVRQSPVRRAVDSPGASPLLAAAPSPPLLPLPSLAELDGGGPLLPPPAQPSGALPPQPAQGTPTQGGVPSEPLSPLSPLSPAPPLSPRSSFGSLSLSPSPSPSPTAHAAGDGASAGGASSILGMMQSSPSADGGGGGAGGGGGGAGAEACAEPVAVEASGDGGTSGEARSPAQRGTPTSPSPSSGKLRVAIGCKDGRSISVAIANHVASQLAARGLVASARHRELERKARLERRARRELGKAEGAKAEGALEAEAPPKAAEREAVAAMEGFVLDFAGGSGGA